MLPVLGCDGLGEPGLFEPCVPGAPEFGVEFGVVDPGVVGFVAPGFEVDPAAPGAGATHGVVGVFDLFGVVPLLGNVPGVGAGLVGVEPVCGIVPGVLGVCVVLCPAACVVIGVGGPIVPDGGVVVEPGVAVPVGAGAVGVAVRCAITQLPQLRKQHTIAIRVNMKSSFAGRRCLQVRDHSSSGLSVKLEGGDAYPVDAVDGGRKKIAKEIAGIAFSSWYFVPFVVMIF